MQIKAPIHYLFKVIFTCVAWSILAFVKRKPPYFGQAFYLAWGTTWVLRFMVTSLTESLVSALLYLVRAISIAKDSFSSVTITLMIGLRSGFGDTQTVAISTAFQTELLSKSPSNFESTMALISPFAIKELTHWLIWIFSWFLAITGWLVIISKRTTPKL